MLSKINAHSCQNYRPKRGTFEMLVQQRLYVHHQFAYIVIHYCSSSMWSRVHVTVRCPSVRPIVNCCVSLWRVCCCVPGGQEILTDCCMASDKQQMWAVSRCQLTYETEHRFAFKCFPMKLRRTSALKLSLTSYRPGGGETICLPPMAVRLAANLRPSAVRTWLSCRQPACL